MGCTSSPRHGRAPSSSRRSPDQGPIDYATWMKEMSQTLGTSICLDVSTLEAFISKICTFHIWVFNKVFYTDVSPYCFLHAFLLSDIDSAYNILNMTCQLRLRQIPEQTHWHSDASRDDPISDFSLHAHERLPSTSWVVGSGSLATPCSSHTHTALRPALQLIG